MYYAIFIVVEKGRGEDAINCAIRSGAKNATITSGKGLGHYDEDFIFAHQFRPEKDVLMILVQEDKLNGVLQDINHEFQESDSKVSTLFALPIVETFGLL